MLPTVHTSRAGKFSVAVNLKDAKAFYQVIIPVHSVFSYLQQIKLVTNKFFALSLIIFTPLYCWYSEL